MAALDDFLSFLQGASNSAASAVSAPVDGINWALGKVGVPVSKKPVGGSEWLREIGFTTEPKNKTAGLLGEAVGGVLPIVAQAKAPQIAAGINQMVANAQAPRTLNPQTGAIVWHGSPHQFSKFDSSKIGTGEGAQAYGHGLYLAESPEVAGSYKKASFGPGASKPDWAYVDVGQKPLLEVTRGMEPSVIGHVTDALSRAGWNPELAIDVFKKAAGQNINQPVAQKTLNVLRLAVKDGVDASRIPSGSLYKVDLPDDAIAKMLDWDKPLSQQAPEVRMLAKDLGISEHEVGAKFYQALTNQARDGAIARGQNAGTTLGASQAAASDDLRAFGITGIRYLDGGSRGVGQGTSNFVIFPQNEGLLTILERNGQPLP